MVTLVSRAFHAVVILLALRVFAITHIARAQSTDAAAEAEFRAGYRALQAGNRTDALVHYRRSLELAPRPRTMFNIATCEEDLGQYAAAWHDYLAFLSLAEDRDTVIVAEAKARIEALRKRLHGQLALGSSPSGASVSVDDERQPRGQTPVALDLEPGRHTLKVSLPGAPVVERTVEIAPDDHPSLQIDFALPSQVVIRADPPEATIAARSEDTATAIGHLDLAVKPGHHAFEVRCPGYRSELVEIDAQPGRTHDVRVSLRAEPRKPPTLVVTGAVGATLTIDGDKTSPSLPRESHMLSTGGHEVTLEHRGRVVWRSALQLTPDEVVRLDVDLSPPRSATRRALTWSIGGFGLASITAGGVVGTLALRDVASDDMDVHARGKTRALVADGLFVAGATALVVAWRLLRSDTSSAQLRREDGGP